MSGMSGYETKVIRDKSGALVTVRADEESLADSADRANAEHAEAADRGLSGVVDASGRLTDVRVEQWHGRERPELQEES